MLFVSVNQATDVVSHLNLMFAISCFILYPLCQLPTD
jgi:hypothetical protein